MFLVMMMNDNITIVIKKCHKKPSILAAQHISLTFIIGQVTMILVIVLTVYFVIDKVIDIFQYLHCMSFHRLHLF